ncbi:exported hypothetical protein [Hyphomicrobiales bacterium]|nr:exported hypothetical protein [Hyphomicrobiales bacterium]CAH1701159.1 exported hypothetical protein [Hyphomicrobiales bacterium]CAI0345124.1 exported hypothetical protein [Hyphomicrobiales bacterium]
MTGLNLTAAQARRPLLRAATVLAFALLGNGFATAQQGPAPDWPTEKCNRYKKAYEQALNRQGKQGLSPEFLASHDAFLAANCQARAEVCARSKQELDLANTLVLMAMNSGMSGTFLPFYCRS